MPYVNKVQHILAPPFMDDAYVYDRIVFLEQQWFDVYQDSWRSLWNTWNPRSSTGILYRGGHSGTQAGQPVSEKRLFAWSTIYCYMCGLTYNPTSPGSDPMPGYLPDVRWLDKYSLVMDPTHKEEPDLILNFALFASPAFPVSPAYGGHTSRSLLMPIITNPIYGSGWTQSPVLDAIVAPGDTHNLTTFRLLDDGRMMYPGNHQTLTRPT